LLAVTKSEGLSVEMRRIFVSRLPKNHQKKKIFFNTYTFFKKKIDMLE